MLRLKWISVKVKLPEHGKFVLLAEVPGSTSAHVGCMDEEKNFWIWDGKDIWPSTPTHWMPKTSIPLPSLKKIGKLLKPNGGDHG